MSDKLQQTILTKPFQVRSLSSGTEPGKVGQNGVFGYTGDYATEAMV